MANENTECDGAKESPHLIPEVPAESGVPLASPSEVEPISGHLEEEEDGPPRRKPGPKPLVESHRMKMIMQFVDGTMPCGELGRLQFLRASQLTSREKAFLVRHECFKELYDAKLFDFFMGLELPTREDLKLIELVGKRVGLSKPQTQVNVQVNNNSGDENKKKDRRVRIQVGE